MTTNLMPLRKPLAAFVAAAFIVTGPGSLTLQALAAQSPAIKGTPAPAKAGLATPAIKVVVPAGPSGFELPQGVNASVRGLGMAPLAPQPAAALAPQAVAELAPQAAGLAPAAIKPAGPEAGSAEVLVNQLAAEPSIATLTEQNPGVSASERADAANTLYSNARTLANSDSPIITASPEGAGAQSPATRLEKSNSRLGQSDSQPINLMRPVADKIRVGAASGVAGIIRAAKPSDYALAAGAAAGMTILGLVVPVLPVALVAGVAGFEAVIKSVKPYGATKKVAAFSAGLYAGIVTGIIGAMGALAFPSLAIPLLATYGFARVLNGLVGARTKADARKPANTAKDGGASGAEDASIARPALPRTPPPLRPTVIAAATDPIVRMVVADGNTVSISVGFGSGLSAHGGSIGLEIGGHRFVVYTQRGDDTLAKLRELKYLIQDAGYSVTETARPGGDTLELSWAIDFAFARPPSGAPPAAARPAAVDQIKDGAASGVAGIIRAAKPGDFAGAAVTALIYTAFGFFAPHLAGLILFGAIGADIGFLSARDRGQPVRKTLLSTGLGLVLGVVLGFFAGATSFPPLIVLPLLAVYTFSGSLYGLVKYDNWAVALGLSNAADKAKDGPASSVKDNSAPVTPPPLHPTIGSLTTDPIANMTISDGNTVSISVGFGGGLSARGGSIGLEIGGHRFVVYTQRGDDTRAKLRELKYLIQDGGYSVTETARPGGDTIELSWVIDFAFARPPSGAPPAAARPAAADKNGSWNGNSYQYPAVAGVQIIETKVKWKAFWKTQRRPAPDVDFDKSFVAVVRLGSRASEGYGVIFQDARETDQELVIRYSERQLGGITTVMTAPWGAKAFPKTSKAIRFERISGKTEASNNDAPRTPPLLPPTVTSLTTDGIVDMTVADDNTVAISVGFGAGTSARGGIIGLAIGGRRFAVATQRGDDTRAKLRELKALIEAGGYLVMETARPGGDTIELTWVLTPV